MTDDDRIGLALERFSSDESLTSGLTDDAAERLLAWIESELRATPAGTAADIDRRASLLRSAAKAAAAAHSDDPRAMLAAARERYLALLSPGRAKAGAGDRPAQRQPARWRPRHSLRHRRRRVWGRRA